MLLHEFINLTYNKQRLIEYLCEKKVIRREITCPQCNTVINITYESKRQILHCSNKYYKQVRGRKKQRKTCNFKISIFHGTWFAKQHLAMVDVCRFIAYFLYIHPPRHTFLRQELQITDHTIVDWTNFCRELLMQWVTDHQQQIGGRGIIVEIDEAKLGRRKHNKGRIVEGQWVFGGIERDSHKFFIVPVPNRSSHTLIPIITRYIAPESIIHSDCWKAYSELHNLNYQHETVNHKKNFIDPTTGAYTQNIERLWREMRAAIPRYGTRTYHYQAYLAEFMFKKYYKFNERIDSFFQIMSKAYPL
ncbi:uncharacterized protein [Temnothorax nylanderi]|uniref:uncharacterized protein n=1 Tax=Temnothorax nylanderi TaxID=102681 RepID=UPI003A848408